MAFISPPLFFVIKGKICDGTACRISIITRQHPRQVTGKEQELTGFFPDIRGILHYPVALSVLYRVDYGLAHADNAQSQLHQFTSVFIHGTLSLIEPGNSRPQRPALLVKVDQCGPLGSNRYGFYSFLLILRLSQKLTKGFIHPCLLYTSDAA